MIANDGGAKKPKHHPAGGSTPPHSPNSALDRPSSGDPSDEDVVGEERVPRGAEGCRGVPWDQGRVERSMRSMKVSRVGGGW